MPPMKPAKVRHNWHLTRSLPSSEEYIVTCSCGWGSPIVLGPKENAQAVGRAHADRMR